MRKIRLSKIVSFLVGALIYMAPNSGKAQANISPLATVTASNCSTGPCSAFNDLNFGTCGTQLVWVSTGGPPSLVPGVDFIEWVFPTVRSFDSLIIHHAQITGRFLTGATVQYWDGAAWVTHTTFSGLSQANCVNRVGIGKLSTDRFRITSFLPGTGQNSNMNFREIEVLEAPSGLHDAAVLSLDSPRVYCAGTHNVVATIANFGINQIDSVDVNWSVNGVAQPVVKFVGLLDTLQGAGSTSAQVVLGNATFAAGATNIQAYTANPNGQIDTLNFNDTVNVAVLSAAPPTGISITNATLNSVDVNALGGAGTVEYEVGPLGFAPGTGTTGSSSVPNFRITGLSQGTTYDVYVRSNCGSGDVSAYVGPQTFNTSFGVPYFQDFENWTPGNLANAAPEGWSRFGAGPDWEAEDATGANENSGNTGPFFDATTPTIIGGMYVYLETSTGAGVDTLFSPPIFIDSALGTVEVGFSYHMFGAAMGTLDVYADTNGVRSLLVSYTGAQQAAQPDPFFRFSTFLNGYQGKSVQLVFVGTRGTSFTSDMSIDNVTIDPVLPLNAGVIEVQNPVGNLCPGLVTPVVGVKNFGSSTLDSVNVVWDINGILDSIMYVGTILPGDTAAVSLASLNVSSTLVYDLEFYTNRPNNAADQFPADDTLKIQGLRTGLSGTLTLDASLPASATNLTSFAQLEQVLNNSGVCGTVTINVAPGTYNESLFINNAPGMSSVNTLTIDGGDSSTTTLTHNNTSNYGTVTIAGTDYVTIRNMRIEATANNGASILLNNASHNTFESNILWANPNSLSTNTNYIISGTTTSISTNGIGSYNVLQNNLMVGGYYSVYMYGAAAAGSSVGNVVHNNEIDSVYYYGSYIFYQDSLEFTNNELDQATRGQINGDGLYLYYSSNFDISGNYIHAQDYGVYLYNFGTNAPPLNGKNLFANNMIISESDWGVYSRYQTEVDFFYNSVATYGTTNPAVQIGTAGTTLIDNFDVRNNVFYSTNTEAFELSGIVDTIFTKMDNNVYYSGAGNMFNINGTFYTDLLAYQTAQASYNASSLDGDPQFLSTSDLHIVGSFINGAGDNSVPITVDIDGDLRPIAGSTAVDPGADEFDPPACPPVANLSTINVTSTSVDIDFDGTSLDYEYQVIAAGTSPVAANSINSVVDSFTVTGLTPATRYDAYVREVCGRGDTSVWLFSSFETFCAPYLTYNTGFEAPMPINETPDCWTEYSTNYNAGANVWVRNFAGVNGPSVGTQALYIYPVSRFISGVDELAAISPQFTDLPLGNKRIRFDANTDDAVNVTLIVGTVDDPLSPTALNAVDTLTFAASDVYANYTVDFSTANGYNGTDEFIFLAHDLQSLGTFDYIRIDEFFLEDIPSCVRPDSLIGDGTGTTTADISWANRPGVTTTQFEMEYGPSGYVFGTGTSVIVNRNDTTLTGLAASTFYDVYVRGICAPNDSSFWIGPSIFQTDCAPIAQVRLPWTEDWETGGSGVLLGSGIVKCGPDFIWEMSTNDPQGRASYGTNAFNTGGTSGAVTLDRAVSGAFAVNYLLLTLDMSLSTPDTTLQLTFDAMEHGEENHPNDSTWIRGSDTSAWIGILDNWASITSTTVYQSFGPYDIDAILATAGQTVSSTFQIRFGQEDNFPAPSDGFTFDNISITGVNVPVGLENVESVEGVSIFPNPSNGLFTLNIETLERENFNVTVRDAQGREVFTENLNVNGKYRNDLDFTSFAKGVYYMQIQTETESTVEKLIIQ